VVRILLTGGAGFIGSHVADRLVETVPDLHLTVLDKMTYAADFRNLERVLQNRHARLIVGDICNLDVCYSATQGVDIVINLAAESHVDNSFGNSLHFTHTNVLGTHTLMDACRVNKVPLILHVSTDEVYGDILGGSFDENSPLNPTNPYSASKAAAEMVIRGYMSSFGLPVMMVRANNVYGTRQYPEKIIPKFCMQLQRGKKLTIHGNGSNIRSYLAVQDFADAVSLLLTSGKRGEVYNVGTTDEFTNLQVAGAICERFGMRAEDHLTFVADRPFNDRRYSISCAKLEALGWTKKHSLRAELSSIVDWYRDNGYRYEDLEL
jgi:UDP-glucose 4,6-dehydratase